MTYILGNYMGSALGSVKDSLFSRIPFFGGAKQEAPSKPGSILGGNERGYY
jgi:hypothetical protein